MARRRRVPTIALTALTALLLPSALLPSGCGLDDTVAPLSDAGPGDGAAVDAQPTRVVFADDALQACVREALGLDKGKAAKQDLRPADLAGLTDLQCPDRSIKALDGLEHATGLQHLSLWENDLQSVAALAALTRLTSLQLGNNAIRSVAPLAKLVGLQRLGLADNAVDDLAPLKGLTQLRWLNLDGNPIDEQDLGQLAGLTKLRWLTVEATKATGAAPLKPLLSKGAQVYMGYASSASDGAGADRLPRADAAAGRLPGRLIGRLPPGAHGGPVRFWYEVDGRSRDVILEFAGQVIRRGDALLLRHAGREAAIEGLVLGRKLGRDQLGRTGEVITLSLKLAPGAAPPAAPEMIPVAAPAPGSVDQGLVPLALASPNQFDAGSCLFMANTGAMELLLHQRLDDPTKIKYQGDTDLSERYLMNASEHVPSSLIRYSVTDVLYTYNALGGALRNKDYPFTAGYVKTSASGAVQKAQQGEDGAQFSCKYNWIDELPADYKATLVPTPTVERTLIFLDPKLDDKSRWRVGLASDDVVDRIKWELRTKRAPVVVIYNHYLYWHASVVVGYDDAYATGGCPMVESMLEYFADQGASSYVSVIKDQMSKQGGCSQKGAFYVRDSIYDGGDEEPSYSYSDTYSFTKKYSKRIVLRSYNWVKYVANHAYTVHRARP